MWFLILLFTCTFVVQAQYNEWRRIDEVNHLGFRQLFTLDDSVTYVASYYGMYRSDDGGRFWREIHSRNLPGDIYSLVGDPRISPQTLVLNTYFRNEGKGTSGVFLSHDAGVTWMYKGGAVGNWGGYVTPAGEDTYYLLCDPLKIVYLDHTGVAHHYINGLHFPEIARIRGIAAFDDNSALIYLRPGTVYVSGKGETPWTRQWSQANDGIEQNEILHIHSEGDDAWAATSTAGIKHATRPDFQWSDASGGLGLAGDPSMRVRSIFRDKRGPLVAITSAGFYSSTDGRNWQYVSNTLQDWEKPAATTIDFDGRYYVLYGSDSLLVSGDNAQTWSLRMKGLVMGKVHELALQGKRLIVAGEDCLFAGDAQTHFHKVPAWKQQIDGLNSFRIRSFARLPDTSIIAIDESGTVSRLANAATIWTTLSHALAGETVLSTAVTPDGTILAGTERGTLFVSSDGGATWVETQTAFSSAPISSVLAVSGTLLLAGSFGEGLFRSTDGGVRWSRVDNGIMQPNITALTRTPDGTLFAGSYGAGVFRSNDQGATWVPTDTDSPGMYVTSLITNHIGIVAAATYDAGVCITRNGGQSWSALNAGFPDLRIRRLLLLPELNSLYAISEDGALYRNKAGLPTSTEALNAPQQFRLLAAYPNPFRESIEVKFDMYHPGTVHVTLFDLLGREMLRITENITTAGRHHKRLPSVSLTPGIYMLALECAGERKIQLVTHMR
ncbi:MAG: T9SS type A sorting domain-containing protein [Bacteroidetes bacterium]|nr:T9SS type A sorting domain-containing protein [Bacteroidota bacterium]